MFFSRRFRVAACLVVPAFGCWFAACTFPDVTINPDANCATDQDCVDGGLGLFCDERGRCATCRSDDDCTGNALGKRCDGSACVMCLEDADCPSGHCDADSGSCLECVGDGDCEGGQRCASGTCVECVEDADCPGVCSDFRCVDCADEEDCTQALCVEHACVACTEADTTYCMPGDTCEDGVCRPMHCNNGELDGDETDENCGGSCPPCAEGKGCMEGADCQTGICESGTCTPCSDPEDCGVEAFCQDGLCAPRREVGESCPNVPGACVENAHCVEGICCESACDGTCMGCSEFTTGAPDGQCAQALPGTPCVTGLGVAGDCTSAGVCGLLGIGN